jgi:hypothetical protein
MTFAELSAESVRLDAAEQQTYILSALPTLAREKVSGFGNQGMGFLVEDVDF